MQRAPEKKKLWPAEISWVREYSAWEGTLEDRYRSLWNLFCILSYCLWKAGVESIPYFIKRRCITSEVEKYYANWRGYSLVRNLSNVSAALQETNLQGHKLLVFFTQNSEECSFYSSESQIPVDCCVLG